MQTTERAKRLAGVGPDVGVVDLRGIDSLRSRIDKVMRVVKTIIGVPDYERYLKHQCERYPDVPPLSKDEFFVERLKAKYSRPGQRCC
jgi:uncharacterized short protein YbdD (DUF466 family)